MRKFTNISHLLIPALFLLFFASCRKEPTTVVRINQEEFTPEEKQKIGDYFLNIAHGPNDVFNLLDTSQYAETVDYANTLVEMLAYTEDIENTRTFNWSANIISNDSIRSAFIMPGGHVFVFSGMLKLLKDESQFVAVLAHEMMYADKGLMIEAIKEEFGGAILGDILLGNEISPAVDQSILEWFVEMSFSESQVRLADAFAINTICPFLYDATGMLRVLEKIDEANEHQTIEWLETRPGEITDRIDSVLEVSETCESLNGNRYEDRFQEMIAKLP